MNGFWMDFFIGVCNAGYQASIAVLFVLAARLLLGALHMPKQYSCHLWFLPYYRCLFLGMIFPEFGSSFFPQQINPVPEEILTMEHPVIYTNVRFLDEAVARALPAAKESASANPMQIWMTVFLVVWIAGAAVLLLYALCSVVFLKWKLRTAVKDGDGIYLVDGIPSPFVMGMIKPKIYLPSDLPKEAREYVVLHEKQHIKEHDPALKIILYLIMSVYWFHPLLWAAYALANKDMEYACDEAVLAEKTFDYRKNYAKALLALSIGKNGFMRIPLAFSEGDPKKRIKRIVSYRKPLQWMSVAGIVILGVLSFGLLTNPVSANAPFEEREELEEIKELETEAGIEEIAANAPEIDLAATVGADGVRLYYADEQKIIFGGYFGLFVYARPQQKIVQGLDLKAIGCDATQGNHACEIRVSQFGTEVYLHPMDSDQMYIYSLSDGALYQEAYSFDGILFYEGCSEDGQSASYMWRGEEKECFMWDSGTIGSISWYEEDFIYHRFFAPEGYEDAVFFEPEDIHDLVRVSMCIDGTLYSMEEDDVLGRIENMLSNAAEDKGGSGCPFYDPMYLTRADGVIGVIYPATDSCAMIRTEGGYYDYGSGDNSEFWGILGNWQEIVLR